MITAFNDASVLDDDDLVGGPDRGEPMRDDQRRPPASASARASATSASDVESRCAVALVEDHDGRFGQQQPGDRQALPLTTGEPVSTFSDNGFQTVR